MKNIYIILFFLLVNSSFSWGQDSFDPDELLVEARELIMNDKYIEGRKVAFRALSKYPNYADILILVGRSYAWEGKNDSASIYLERAIIASPQYEDGYSAYLDNLSWSDQYEQANEVVNRAKQAFGEPLPHELRYKEARLLYYQEDYDKAYELAEGLFSAKYKKDDMLAFIQTLQRYRRNSAIGLSYDYDNFRGDIQAWNTFSLYAKTRTKLTGSLIGRVTQSSRFGNQGTLFELDAYPSLGKNTYAYLNIGGSGASFFPSFRVGASIYYSLPKSWEIEGGFRYLKFSDATYIYTASLGKYVGNWWFNLRTNLIPKTDSGFGTSANLQARYYFKTGEDYLTFQVSSGVSPDEESRDKTQLLNSYRAKIGYQQLVTDRMRINASTSYSKDELFADKFRYNLSVSLGVEYRF